LSALAHWPVTVSQRPGADAGSPNLNGSSQMNSGRSSKSTKSTLLYRIEYQLPTRTCRAADTAVTANGCRPAPCAYRRPEETTPYPLVQSHLETDLALAREGDGDGRNATGTGVPVCDGGTGVPPLPRLGLRPRAVRGVRPDVLAAFSCKGPGLGPSCTTRRMAEAAAYASIMFSPLPVRQRVLSVPKRLCSSPEPEPAGLGAVLHILLRVIETHLRQPGAAACQATGAAERCGP
jgi:hypothetical protein